jgi:hypothetical protein
MLDTLVLAQADMIPMLHATGKQVGLWAACGMKAPMRVLVASVPELQ